MSTLEEAIQHFEALQRRYTKQHQGKPCEYVKIALEALYKMKEENTQLKGSAIENA